MALHIALQVTASRMWDTKVFDGKSTAVGWVVSSVGEGSGSKAWLSSSRTIAGPWNADHRGGGLHHLKFEHAEQ
jgi:hypothetical protein